MSKWNQWLEPALMPETARWLSRMLGLQWCEWAHLVWSHHCFGTLLDGNTCHTQNHHAKHQHPDSGSPMAKGHSAHWEPGGHHHHHLTQCWPVVMNRESKCKPKCKPCIKHHIYKDLYAYLKFWYFILFNLYYSLCCCCIFKSDWFECFLFFFIAVALKKILREF